MYLTCLNASHELKPSCQLAFDKEVYAIVRAAVPYRSIWVKLHCPERGLRVCHPMKP